jgi:trans-aconitate 2-methyltransferase
VAREWDSAAYHRLSDPQLGWALKVINRLELLAPPPEAQILDAGCGTGRVTAELLLRFPQAQVVAVDASENMIADARRTLQDFGSRVSVERRDLLDIPHSDAFDVVFSTAVFHWIKDHDRLFAVLFRALKSGGFLMAQCGGGPNLKRVRDRVQRLIESETFSRYFQDWQRVWEYPGPELTEERLLRAGFEGVSCWLEASPVPLNEAGHYGDFLSAVILHPYLERLPVQLQTELRDHLVREAAQDDPPFVLDYWRLNIQGRKPA